MIKVLINDRFLFKTESSDKHFIDYDTEYDIKLWALENNINFHKVSWFDEIFEFDNEENAVLFALTWG